MKRVRKAVSFLQEFSLPLIFGVVAGLVHANLDVTSYEHLVHLDLAGLFGGGHEVAHGAGHGAAAGGHHGFTLHFLINDLFMALFFGVAAKEITESFLPGGALNPPRKAVNPLFGTLGGVVGPVVVFIVGVQMFITGPESLGMASFPTSGVVVGSTVFNDATSLAMNGWGIPTATDIALAWLIARLVFGTRSAAVSFLLLLAVADDAIGLGIIAVFYPSAPPEPMWMLLILAGMGAAYGMRKKNVQTWVPYVVIGGTLSWFGFYLTNLHPALALVPIIPFLPGPVHDTGLFAEEDEVDRVEHGESFDDDLPAHHQHTPLHNFEHHLKLPVDFGLFFFAWANAGVQITGELGVMTWLVLAALIIGKTLGVTLFSYGATFLGFPLPDGLRLKHLVVVGIIAGLGLTVALFVSGEAFKGQGALLDDAKMGSLLSFVAAFLAMGVGAILRVKTDYKVAKAEKSLPDSRHFTAESSRRFPERPLAKPEKKS